MTDYTTPKLPEVKFNKNGYEIRSDILSLAKDMVAQDFHYKYLGWEVTAKKEGDQVVSTVDMPQYPGIEKVLETAEKLYGFVNQGTRK